MNRERLKVKNGDTLLDSEAGVKKFIDLMGGSSIKNNNIINEWWKSRNNFGDALFEELAREIDGLIRIRFMNESKEFRSYVRTDIMLYIFYKIRKTLDVKR